VSIVQGIVEINKQVFVSHISVVTKIASKGNTFRVKKQINLVVLWIIRNFASVISLFQDTAYTYLDIGKYR
jgi:hypothetical protein